MLFVVVSILAWSLGARGLDSATAPALGDPENTNNKIINILKENLQKDNDDYKEMTSNKASASTRAGGATSSPPSAVPASAPASAGGEYRPILKLAGNVHQPAGRNQPVNENRRALRGDGSVRPDPGDPHRAAHVNRRALGDAPRPSLVKQAANLNGRVLTARALRPNFKRGGLANRRAHGGGKRPPKQKRDPKRYPKYVNKEKAEKVAEFIEKYQGLVTKVMSNGAGGAGDAVSGGAGDAVSGGAGDAVPRGLEVSSPGLPSAAELDMAPAIGGHVHSLRMQNRLCQRYVMNPEGPKYDSKGRLYLPEYTTKRARDFTATRAKRFLLPKCCNCCAKSVLGCE